MILRWDMFPRAIRAVFRTLWFRIRGYEAIVDASEHEKRSDCCQGCVFRWGEQCGQCGCFWEAKILLAAEECPDGQWKSVRRKRA